MQAFSNQSFFIVRQVSIIIPTFNSEKYLEPTLQSVMAQDYQNFECIVVDDNSADRTREIVENFTQKDIRFKLFERPEMLPKGPSISRNFGTEKAKGDYLIFLDSDDILSTDCLSNRIKLFAENQDCDFLVFQMERFLNEPNFSIKNKKANNDESKILYSFLNLHAEWPITSPIYKLEFFKKIGFNVNLTVFEDLEAAIKAIISARDFKVFETVDCYYRNDENYAQKFESLLMKTKMVKGFITFFLSLNDFLKHNPENRIKNSDIKSHLIQSYKKLFEHIILNNAKTFADDNKTIIRFLAKNGFLSRNESFRFQFLAQILLPFANIKGSGISRLIKCLYR